MTDTKEGMKLLGMWASPFVSRARIALNLKGLQYQYIEDDLLNKSELLLEFNPVYKKVPVLIHNGRSICESLVILQYIDEVSSDAGPTLLPSDPYQRALVRFWAAYLDDKYFSALGGIIKGQTEEAKLEAAIQISASLELLEEAYNEISEGKSFFSGESVGALDIVLGSLIGWTKAAEKMLGAKLFDEKKVPSLVLWADRFCSAECVKGVIPEVEKLEAFGKLIQQGMLNGSPSNG